jgi:hypothetical protein
MFVRRFLARYRKRIIINGRAVVRMIDSDAPRGRTTAQAAAHDTLLMSTGRIWQGRVHSRPLGRDFVVSFFGGGTDGVETN